MALRAPLRVPLSVYSTGISRPQRQIIRAHAETIDEHFNGCVEASRNLTLDLREHGHSAHLLQCTGLKTPAPLADSRWHDLAPQKRWVHFLVKIGEDVVDLTRRQFFPASAFPYVQSMAACDAEWDDITLSIARRSEATELLPA